MLVDHVHASHPTRIVILAVHPKRERDKEVSLPLGEQLRRRCGHLPRLPVRRVGRPSTSAKAGGQGIDAHRITKVLGTKMRVRHLSVSDSAGGEPGAEELASGDEYGR